MTETAMPMQPQPTGGPAPPHGLEELVYGLSSENEDERKLCLSWIASIGTRKVLPYLERMTADPSVSVRHIARQLAGQLREKLDLQEGQSKIRDPLVLLQSANPKARLQGAILCYELQSTQLKRALMELLEIEPDAFVRASLVKALAHYPEAPVIERLADCLFDPDARVRANTIETLMRYDHPALFSRISNLLHDPDNRVKGTVLVYLAQRKPEKIQRLLTSMATSQESWAQMSARYALKSLGWPIPVAPNPTEDRSKEGLEIAQMMKSPDFELRIQAVFRAHDLQPHHKLPLLRAQLDKESHDHVIATITRALGTPGVIEDIPLLRPYLNHEDPRVRSNTLEGIAKIGGSESLQLIEGMLKDPAPRVRAAAVTHLAKIRQQQSIEVLRRLLDSTNNEELAAGLHALNRLERTEGVRFLNILASAWTPEHIKRAQLLVQAINERSPVVGWLPETLSSLKSGQVSDSKVLDHPLNELRENVTSSSRLKVIEKAADSEETGAASLLEIASQDPSSSISKFASQALIRVQNDLIQSRVLASLGAEVIKLWDTGEFSNAALESLIDAVGDAESSIARGQQVEESINARYKFLTKIGQTVVELRKSGPIRNHGLEKRVQAILASLEAGGVKSTANGTGDDFRPVDPGVRPAEGQQAAIKKVETIALDVMSIRKLIGTSPESPKGKRVTAKHPLPIADQTAAVGAAVSTTSGAVEGQTTSTRETGDPEGSAPEVSAPHKPAPRQVETLSFDVSALRIRGLVGSRSPAGKRDAANLNEDTPGGFGIYPDEDDEIPLPPLKPRLRSNGALDQSQSDSLLLESAGRLDSTLSESKQEQLTKIEEAIERKSTKRANVEKQSRSMADEFKAYSPLIMGIVALMVTISVILFGAIERILTPVVKQPVTKRFGGSLALGNLNSDDLPTGSTVLWILRVKEITGDGKIMILEGQGNSVELTMDASLPFVPEVGTYLNVRGVVKGLSDDGLIQLNGQTFWVNAIAGLPGSKAPGSTDENSGPDGKTPKSPPDSDSSKPREGRRRRR